MAAPSRPGSATNPVVAQPIAPDKSIDCIGFFCPIPIPKTKGGDEVPGRGADPGDALRRYQLRSRHEELGAANG